MTKSHIFEASLLATALLVFVGCGGSDDMSTGPAAGGINAMSNRSGDLELTIASDKSAHTRGEPVRMTFTVENVGVMQVRLDFSSGLQHDFEALDQHGLRWNWAHGRNFTQTPTSITIRSGETWVRSTTWNQADNAGQLVQPGFYRLAARLATGRPYRTEELVIQIR